MDYAMILDTETVGLNTPFCYDIGYIIITADGEIVKQAHYIIEQSWHNLPLFESAYYKEKRPKYISLMRGKKAKLVKYGQAMKAIRRDIKQFCISCVYAYNAPFDDKVITFNCDWYKCENPFDNIPFYDIWGYASEFITNNDEYIAFCEKYSRFTESKNYSGSAETVYQFITNNPDFVEEHMGLYDSEIEAQILVYCIKKGAQWGTEYKVKKVLKREDKVPFTIKVNGKIIYRGKYVKKFIRGDEYSFTEGE